MPLLSGWPLAASGRLSLLLGGASDPRAVAVRRQLYVLFSAGLKVSEVPWNTPIVCVCVTVEVCWDEEKKKAHLGIHNTLRLGKAYGAFTPACAPEVEQTLSGFARKQSAVFPRSGTASGSSSSAHSHLPRVHRSFRVASETASGNYRHLQLRMMKTLTRNHFPNSSNLSHTVYFTNFTIYRRP